MENNYLPHHAFLQLLDPDSISPPNNLTIWKNTGIYPPSSRVVNVVSNYGACGTIQLKGDHRIIRLRKLQLHINYRSKGDSRVPVIQYPRLIFNSTHEYIHRLVAAAFSNVPLTDSLQVDHLDGCHLNNRADNLEIVTKEENIYRRYHHPPLTQWQKARWFYGKEEYEAFLPHYQAIRTENFARRRRGEYIDKNHQWHDAKGNLIGGYQS